MCQNRQTKQVVAKVPKGNGNLGNRHSHPKMLIHHKLPSLIQPQNSMTVSEDNGGIHKTCHNPSQASYTVGE